jgi:hypothetical protein
LPFPAVTIIPRYDYDLENFAAHPEESVEKFINCILCETPFYYEIFEKLAERKTILNFIRNASLIGWFRQQHATWNRKFQVNFTEVRTYFGMAFTFNMMQADKLMNFKR